MFCPSILDSGLIDTMALFLSYIGQHPSILWKGVRKRD
jgi:hypothetical protein